MSNDAGSNQQITPFDGYGPDATELSVPGAGGGGAPMSSAPPLADAFHGGPGGGGTGGGGGIVKLLHRCLRGRYWIALVLGILFGAAGGYAGFASQKPVYRADSVLRFRQNIKTLPTAAQTGFLSNFEEVLASEQMTMTSRRVITDAMKLPEWAETGLGPALTGDLQKRLTKDIGIEHTPHTEYVKIYFLDGNPDVALAAVRCLTKAYEVYARSRSQGEDKRLDVLEKARNEVAGKVRSIDENIKQATNEFMSPDLTAVYAAKLEEVNRLESRLNEAELALDSAKRKKDARKTIYDLTENQIGMIDPHMRALLIERENVESEQKRLVAAGVLPGNVKMKQLQALLDAQSQKVARYVGEWKDMQVRLANDPSLAGVQTGLPRLLQQSPEIIEAEVQALRAKFQQMKDQMLAVGRRSLEIEELKRRREELVRNQTDYGQQINAIVMEQQLGERLVIVDYGNVMNAPYKDRRKMFGAAGAMFGFGLPVGILILLGLMDKRYRYSDEANAGVANVPLLGILPKLPDRLADPEQAAIAAHCLHQIRIMLQVGGDPETRRVFMITSASTGDGKTSLTMALGLSFAASGSKTLVIDCDMVGQGLTHRLKAHNVPGLIETLNLGTLRGHVRKTATKGLYVLPIGKADAVHAGVLSPKSINRLLAACREHFDVIVIDTGPILGSLEAAVVAAEADGVIMAVARGQQQPLVERAIRYLRSIHANLFGIVFNRAEHRDFQRSVGTASLRSASVNPAEPRALLPESDEAARFGPLARSVASNLPDGSSAVIHGRAGHAAGGNGHGGVGGGDDAGV